MATKLYIANDHVLELNGLKDAVTGSYINSATVTAVLKDQVGNQVPGQTWPLTLSYVSGSNGIYRGTLENTLSLTPGVRYVAEITVSGAGIPDSQFVLNVVAAKRYA